MDLFELVTRRRSVRAFHPEALRPEHLERILAVAQRAPSAGNLQAYQMVVVRDPRQRRALARAAFDQSFVGDAPLVLVFLADPERSGTRYGRRGRELFALQDATIAAAHAQLAATALGYGSVWVGAFDERAVSEVLDAPSSLRPVCLLVVGHAAEEPALTPRRPLGELAHADRVNTSAS
jgi:nitroreductase